MIIIVDGPEKSGKSTAIQYAAKELGAEVRHWGPIDPDHRVYGPAILEDLNKRGTVIWDRSWASEAVYSILLGRGRPLQSDPFLGEWLFSRAVVARFMFVGQMGAHDETDLPVDPQQERDAFRKYASVFEWTAVPNAHNQIFLEEWTDILKQVIGEHSRPIFRPPRYAGPDEAPVVFVEDKFSKTPVPGGVLPFTDAYSNRFAHDLGLASMYCGWTTAHAVPPQYLKNRIVVSCGEKAARWVTYYIQPIEHISFGSLRYFYMSQTENTRADRIKRLIDTIVEKGNARVWKPVV